MHRHPHSPARISYGDAWWHTLHRAPMRRLVVNVWQAASPPWYTPPPAEHTAPMSTCPRCHWQQLHYNLKHYMRVRQEAGI